MSFKQYTTENIYGKDCGVKLQKFQDLSHKIMEIFEN